jgi:uncharacterized protein
VVGVGLATFVNRTSELRALADWYDRPGPGLAVVFGRKRVGKTWLITKFAEHRRVIRHTARGRPLLEEMRLISAAAHTNLDLPRRSLVERPFTGWSDMFEVLATAAETGPLVIVLDEFPQLMGASPGLEEELRAVWDSVVVGNTNLKFLICGSSVRVMEALQEHQGAMFGRAELRLRVVPFRPHEAALMLPSATPSERACAWGVCGGIPRYLAMWDSNMPFAANLNRLVCNEQGPLLSEGELVLVDEDIAGHRGARLPEQVLRALGTGHTTYSSISAAVTGKLPTRTLKDLTDVRLLERIVPVTDDEGVSKRTYYRIADNFLAFWLECVEPHRSHIEQGLGPTVAPVIAAAFADYMGPRYESALREHLRRLAHEGALHPEAVAVGEWWRIQGASQDDPCQLDAVVLAGRKRTPVIVGECKWGRKVNGSSILGALKRKLHDSQLVHPDDVEYYVCAREHVERADGMHVITAADIFA